MTIVAELPGRTTEAEISTGIPVCRRTGSTLSEGWAAENGISLDPNAAKAERRRGERAERALSKGFEEIDDAHTANRQRAGRRQVRYVNCWS